MMKNYENFCASLKNLSEIYEYEEPYNNVTLTGSVALYGICFEQSWKALKEILQTNGYPESSTGSPRMILKTAFQAGLITDEQLWLSAMVSRNNVANAYNSDIALEIIRQCKSKYYQMFQELKQEIESGRHACISVGV